MAGKSRNRFGMSADTMERLLDAINRILPAAPSETRKLVSRMARKGVLLTADGDKLYASPRKNLTSAMRTELRANAEALIALLGETRAHLYEKAEVVGEVAGRSEAMGKAAELLEANPKADRGVYVDMGAGEYISVAVAIKGIGTYEQRIKREDFDTLMVVAQLISKIRTMN